MKVVIIKYNAGNICSLQFALQRLGITTTVTDDPCEIVSADKIIFPGVGEAGTAMKYLKTKRLNYIIRSLTQPVLGICLGMQLLCNSSEEGNTRCLGVIPQGVKKFRGTLKVPQVGWNSICGLKSTLFQGIREEEYMYFVHSYYVEPGENTTAMTEYGISFSAALQKDNFYATQFHPEKSGEKGQLILQNFLNLT
ncbi:MAG: imidazole glycerol phosphate synthase subunit HisH [Bacteroidales bacterium]|jgi:glutamine amidotransferase|nr:imidazole glycerol phosphate synthase subunit HisH [Bacteroidales bacterium]